MFPENMTIAPPGKANALYNKDEVRVSAEVYDIYRFLHQHPTKAPTRRKDVLRASINYTPFGYIFGGLVSSEAALENATEAMRIHGAYGYSTEDHVERYYRDAPLLCIGEGTNEIQRITITKQLVARSHAPA